MLVALLAVALGEVVRLNSETIQSVLLANFDRVEINAVHSRVFIAVQSYWYFGTLTINMTDSSHASKSYVASPGSRLAFSDCVVTIEFVNSVTTCRLDVYLIPRDICDPQRSLHSRYIMTAVSSIPDLEASFCWFYDFAGSVPTFQTADSNGTFDVVIPSADQLLIQKLKATEKLPSRFILVARSTTVSTNVKFTSPQSYCNWNEKDAAFQTCTIDNCEPSVFPIARYQETDRSVKPLVWISVLGPTALVVLFCCLQLRNQDRRLDAKAHPE